MLQPPYVSLVQDRHHDVHGQSEQQTGTHTRVRSSHRASVGSLTRCTPAPVPLLPLSRLWTVQPVASDPSFDLAGAPPNMNPSATQSRPTPPSPIQAQAVTPNHGNAEGRGTHPRLAVVKTATATAAAAPQHCAICQRPAPAQSVLDTLTRLITAGALLVVLLLLCTIAVAAAGGSR